MRSKLIVALLAFSLVLLGALLLVWPSGKGQADSSEALDSSTTLSGRGASENPEPTLRDQNQSNNVPTALPETATPLSQRPAAKSPPLGNKPYIEARIAELEELALQTDASSLTSILSELTNPEPSIRRAAIEAAAQFGSRDAISKLSEAAAQADDPKEKAALTEAIEFLKLPSLTEVLAKAKTH